MSQLPADVSRLFADSESELALLRQIERSVMTDKTGILVATPYGAMLVSDEQLNDHVTLQVLTGRITTGEAAALVQRMVRESREAFERVIRPQIDQLVREIDELRRGGPPAAPAAAASGGLSGQAEGSWSYACPYPTGTVYRGGTFVLDLTAGGGGAYAFINGTLYSAGEVLPMSGMVDTEGRATGGADIDGSRLEWTGSFQRTAATTPLRGWGKLSYLSTDGIRCAGDWNTR